MPTRWLDDDEMRAWRMFIESVGTLQHALEADLTRHGLTLGDYQVLVNLAEAPGRSMRMCDLAATLHLSPSGLTRRLDGLVRAGLVERVACASDRRVMHAHLTDAGLRKLRAAAPDHVAGVRRHLIDVLDADQVRQLGDIFERVYAGLHPEPART